MASGFHPASMRPPEFTGGNLQQSPCAVYAGQASMRPPEFTGGNLHPDQPGGREDPRFNEAAGIHRRKPPPDCKGIRGRLRASMRPPEFTGGNALSSIAAGADLDVASMRPPEFTGGNLYRREQHHSGKERFNEAAGIHRRKHMNALVTISSTWQPLQ